MVENDLYEEQREEPAVNEMLLAAMCSKTAMKQFAKAASVDFFHEIELDEKGKIKGKCEIAGVATFHYHLSPQDPESGCLYGGTVSLVDHETGWIMKKKGQAYRDQVRKRRELGLPELPPNDAAFNIFKRLRIRSQDLNIIRMMITIKALELFAENILRLATMAQKQGRIEEMTFPLAVAIYGHKYLKMLHGSADKRDRVRQRLTRIAKVMGATAIKDLDERIIKGVMVALGSNAETYIRTARDFLEALAAEVQRPTSTENAFGTYLRSEALKRRKKDKADEKAREAAKKTDVFSTAELLRLYRKIEEEYEDGRAMALVLAFEGIPLERSCDFLWEDLEFTRDWVVIKYRRDELVGGQKDFSFAAGRFASRILRKRYEFVCRTAGEQQAQKLPVLSIATDVRKGIRKDSAEKYSRTIIEAFAPESYASMIGDVPREAGIKLLHNTRNARLEYECGIAEDTGMMRHLQHLAPASVQAEHYRALTDESGLHVQEVLLRRDTLGMEAPTGKQVTQATEDGRTMHTVHAQDLERPLAVRMRLKLKAGEQVRIRNNYGCMLGAGMITSKNEKDA